MLTRRQTLLFYTYRFALNSSCSVCLKLTNTRKTAVYFGRSVAATRSTAKMRDHLLLWLPVGSEEEKLISEHQAKMERNGGDRFRPFKGFINLSVSDFNMKSETDEAPDHERAKRISTRCVQTGGGGGGGSKLPMNPPPPLEVSSFVLKSTAPCAFTASDHVFALNPSRVSSDAAATFIQLSTCKHQ